MDAAAVALRHRYTIERSWTGKRVADAIRTAWSARPRTVEHTEIMQWPSLFLPIDHDLRMAVHMMGLNAQAPYSYPLRDLVHGRLGWSWNKFARARAMACDRMAGALNARARPLIIVVAAA